MLRPLSLGTSALVAVALLPAGAQQQQRRAAPAVREIRLAGKRSVARVWSTPGPDGRELAHYSLLEARATNTRVLLSFTDNASDELGFELERSPDGLVFAPLVGLAANDTQHADTGLAPHTTYHYRARAFNSFGPSAWSNVAVVVTRRAAPAGPP